MSGLELANVIRHLREELDEALHQGTDQRLRFELGPLELSLSFTVGKASTPGAKMRFWVVEAGTETTFLNESVQTIKLVLTPRDTAAGALTPDGRIAPPLIEGTRMDDER